MNKETMIAIPADPNDPEDFDVTVAGLERAHIARRLRMLRHRLGLDQEAFAQAFDIPLEDLVKYEWVRQEIPPAVQAYLKVIEAEPELVRGVIAGELQASLPS